MNGSPTRIAAGVATHFATPHRDIAAMDLAALQAYWRDPSAIDAEQQRQRDLHNTIIDCARIKAGTRWPADWSNEDKADATARLLAGKDVP